MKTIIVIPSYWGRSEGELFNPTDAVYDHPTPLNLEGTLARALDSFGIFNRSDFEVVIIAAATHPELEQAVAVKVAGIISPFQDKFDIHLLTPAMVNELRAEASARMGEEVASLISCYGYSNIRNLCLIAGHMRGADNVILIDDDELIEYPEFLDRAMEFMPGSGGEVTVKGKAGWYMRPDGGYLGPPTHDAVWMEWLGAEAMNAGFMAVIAPGGRMGPTPFAFGGNMVISREIFMNIAFDPKITRGEDIDFVFNAMMSGYEFVMDRELWVRHRPPTSHVPDWMGFRQNALRFTYARQKLLTQGAGGASRIVDLDELQPYPGHFMGPDLDEKIRKTCALLGQQHIGDGDTAGYHESMLNLELVEDLKQREHNACGEYLKYEAKWRTLMKGLG